MSAIETAPERPNPRLPAVWHIRGRELRIDRPIVVGILNVTPDSFSDGGQFESTDAALEQAERMLAEGADAVDIGGESTRPQGARAVSSSEEMDRILPTIRAVRGRFATVPISVDTTKSEVASAAIAEGADIMNDVSGFRIDPRMGEIAAATGAGVVLMHSRGSVEEMGTYRHANYGEDVVAAVHAELGSSLANALEAGVDRRAIVLDPGIGFAKRSEHSLLMLARLEQLTSLGCAIMVGVSRKRFIGELSGVATARERVAGTVGANVAALMHGARLFRVHDVAANRQALDVAWGIIRAGQGATSSGDSPSRGSQFPVPGSRRS